MKTLKTNLKIAILVILFAATNLFSAKSFASCIAGFTWLQTAPNVITFTNTSTGTTLNTNYWWYFGDGGYSDSISPVYTYNIPGTYAVCLQIYDSLAGCNSTFCDTIIVTGVIICNLSVSTYIDSIPDCSTCATGVIEAGTTGGTAPFSYLWSNGATTQDLINILPGTYTCCVTDANNCSACSTVILDTCAIQAGFTWTQTSNNTIQFHNTSSSLITISDYFWTLGNSTWYYGDTAENPTVHYNVPGTYYVCLEIQTDSGCWSTFCDSVTVTGVNCNLFTDSLSEIDATCLTCADGSAATHLSGGTSPYTYSWYNGPTTSSLSNVLPGTYGCYVTDANGCSTYNSIQIGPYECSANFTLIRDTNIAHHYWAINNATGTPPITYYWNWGDSSATDSGAYPSHIYTAPGVYTICLTIYDSVGCNRTFCSSDSIQRTTNTMIYVNVEPPTFLGINTIESLSNWAVYPNPVSNSMTINYALSHSTSVIITIYDMLGNKVSDVVNEREVAGQHATVWSAASVPQGIYLMQIRTDDKVINQKITVMR